MWSRLDHPPSLSTMQGLRAAPPAAFLLLLLRPLLLAAAAPGAERELNPSSRLAAGAARVALHYLNFQAASPGALLALGQVRKATLKVGGRRRGRLRLRRGAVREGGFPGRAGGVFKVTLEKVQLIIILIMEEQGGGAELSRPEGSGHVPAFLRVLLSGCPFSQGLGAPGPFRASLSHHLLPSGGSGHGVPSEHCCPTNPSLRGLRVLLSHSPFPWGAQGNRSPSGGSEDRPQKVINLLMI